MLELLGWPFALTNHDTIGGKGQGGAVPVRAPLTNLLQVIYRIAEACAVDKAQLGQLFESLLHAVWAIRPFPDKQADLLAGFGI